MKKEWYLSFHGGEERKELNNIHVYSQSGRELRKALDTDHLPASVELRELRAHVFGPDGDLYIANAFRECSQILRFSRERDKHNQHRFHNIFIEFDQLTNPGLSHPFGVTFDHIGNLFVTSQNTNLVLRYHGPRTKLAGKPLPLAPALAEMDIAEFAPGTFCAPAAKVANGLKAVRGILIADELLYVANRDADCINKFDPVTGADRGRVVAPGLIDKPIHLAAYGNNLYIGNRGNESIARYNLRTEIVRQFIAPRAGGLKNPSGLAVGNDGYIYVASRTSRQILRYRIEDGAADNRPFIDELQDEPQFITPIMRH
jgi:streptogramin lyase